MAKSNNTFASPLYIKRIKETGVVELHSLRRDRLDCIYASLRNIDVHPVSLREEYLEEQFKEYFPEAEVIKVEVTMTEIKE